MRNSDLYLVFLEYLVSVSSVWLQLGSEVHQVNSALLFSSHHDHLLFLWLSSHSKVWICILLCMRQLFEILSGSPVVFEVRRKTVIEY